MFATLAPQLTHGSAIPATPPPLFFGLIFLFYPVILLVYALYLPAAFSAATQADRGVVVSFRQAYGVAWSRFGRSLWLMVLCMLILILPAVVIAALIGGGAALMHHGAAAGAGPAYAFFLIPLLVLLYLGILVYSVLIMLRFAVAYPACIEEDLPAWKALKRSADLTGGAKGRIFLVLLVVYAVVYAVEIVCILVLVGSGGGRCFRRGVCARDGWLAGIHHSGRSWRVRLRGHGRSLRFASYAAFTTALAVLYHDQRLRKDVLAPVAPLA